MKFEWDPVKDSINRRKHGVTFLEACYVFADKYMLTLYDKEHAENEDRWITIGQIPSNKMLLVIHTYRQSKGKESVRIISARKATRKEEKKYLKRRGR